MKHSASLISTLLLLMACAPSTDKRTAVTDVAEAAVTRARCFRNVTGGDSLLISLNIVENDVTGTLRWLPAEKDKMVGTLEGVLQGDTITAIYHYQAEGVQAREEKIFRITADSLYIKHGPLVEQQGTLVLQNKHEARFTEAVAQADCL